MSDPIDRYDRALIDAALAAGRVSVMPPCTFTPEKPQRANCDWLFFNGPANKRQTPVPPEVARRRLQVREMTEAGRSCAEMAETLGVQIDTIWKDRTVLRQQGRIA